METTVDSTFIRRAVEVADLNAVRVALYQQTGDPELAQLPTTANLDEAQRELLISKAVAWLEHNAGPARVAEPEEAELRTLLNMATAEEMGDLEFEARRDLPAFKDFPWTAEWTDGKPELPEGFKVAIIGSGFQARTQVEAIREVRKLREIRVWSRSEAKRLTFAKETGARPMASAEEAVRGADIVVTATSSKDPVLESAWISPGTHINAMGSNRADRRELPSDLIARADLIAVDSIEQSKIESGDLLLAPVDWNDGRIVELCHIDRRPPGNPVTIFKSNGLGTEDVAAAAFVYEQLLQT